jgi:hypothetical protein
LDGWLVAPRDADAAAGRLLHQPGAGDMVGMAVRVDDGDQLEVQLAQERMVACVLLEDRIDEHCVASPWIAQQIGVRRRRGVEQLTKDQVRENRRPPDRACRHLTMSDSEPVWYVAFMNKPKLIYFDAPVSRGEECRLALHLAGIDFEDDRSIAPTGPR